MQIYKPVFIIGSYRGGTSLLFRLLSESDELWSLYRESNHMWQKYHRHPAEKSDTVILQKTSSGFFKNLVNGKTAGRVDSERIYFDNHYHYSSYSNYILGYLGRVRFLRETLSPVLDLINIVNYYYKKNTLKKYRFVDKTPPNVYRIAFLKALYPDAKFIYLLRERDANIKSLINAWTHQRKFLYKYREYLTSGLNLNIAGYSAKVWKFFIPLNWQKFLSKNIEEVCAYQYDDAHAAARTAFATMDKSQWLQVQFEDLLAEPNKVMSKICDFVELDYSTKMQKLVKTMPAVNTSS